MGSGVSVLCTVALAGLLAAFFVISLVRGLGATALAFSGLGAVLTGGLAVIQWRTMKRPPGGPRG